jgi:hypothetical protein
MTVSSSTSRVSYSGNGVTVAFAVPFYFLANSQLLVVLRSSAGVETTQVLGTNYTVTGAGVLTGGTVTMTVAPASGATLVISRNVPLTQETDLQPNDRLPAETLEQTVDKLTMITQQIDESVDRAIKFPVSDSSSLATTLPSSSVRAGKYLGFDASGNVSVASGPATPYDSADISFLQAGTGAVIRDVQSRLRERVSVKDFGAVCNGSADDSAAVQLALNYCAANNWPTLVIPGKCKIVTSLVINRLVDQNSDEFIILGEGPDAGFFTAGNVVIFTSTLPYTTAPQSEFITFENLRFESSSFFNSSYVLSENFLRIKFQNCLFFLIRCMISTIYAQTMYFLNCNIRNNPPNFINVNGSYDVKFTHCIIENGFTTVRCIDAVRGTNGLSFTSCVIEGIQSSVCDITGASGFALTNCHLESNYSPEFNFFAGGISNKSISITGNYIFNPNGATMYYGPTERVISSGNTVSPSLFHDNADLCTNLVSIMDYAPGGISDGTNVQLVNRVYRAGNAASTLWSDTTNGIAKDTSNRFGIGYPVQANIRLTVAGADQTSSNFAGVFFDSNGNDIVAFRNDRQVLIPALQDFADDAAAATGGISVGALYRTGSAVKVRVS